MYILQAQINLVRSRRIYSEDCVFPVYIYPLNDPQLALYMDQNISSLKKPSKLFSESFMKFSADFVCQLCWRIDCRAEEIQVRYWRMAEISDLELIVSNEFYLVG